MTKLVLLGAFFLGLGACATPATLSGRWVFLTGGESVAVGQANQPQNGGPLHLLPGTAAGGACLSSAEYDSAFGARCEEHESEGASPSIDTYVRWYCAGEIAVRVRLEACERADRYRVAEIAVATN